MTVLEEILAQPRALPQAVAAAVSSIPSQLVAAPRALPTFLLHRLDDIATRHNGQVPIHGRLFAQWMHLAFPNECARPRSRLSDSVPVTTEEWNHTHRSNNVVTKEEKDGVMAAANRSTHITSAAA